MLELNGLSISFGGKPAVKDFSLRAGENERIAVIGGNGSGKTTIALFLAGVIPEFIPARVEGKFLCGKKIGLVMQNPDSQFISLTVRDELQGMQSPCFGIEKLLDRNVFELSEGEKQKVSLVSNILNKCGILVLDEPLELLDPGEARRFLRVIRGIRGKTIIWFDKTDAFVNGWRKVFLSGFENPALPRKKRRKAGQKVLEADFSLKKNGFALRGAKLELRDGEKIAVIGNNGSGKSTALKAIAGALKVNGKISPAKRFSFAPQNPTNLFFEETVEAELFSAGNAKKLGIGHLLRENPIRMSKGQQKMASIAAIAPGTIALLDEPTTWLDGKNRAAVCNFINNSSQPMVIATHDRAILEYCDRVFIIEKGVLAECSGSRANRFFQNSPSK